MLACTTKASAKLLAITHRFGHEAIEMKSPYAITSADGGGSILQRFGTPPHFTGTPTGLTYHKFGVVSSQSPWTGGNHNLFYSASPASTATKGQETPTTFVNNVADEATSSSFVFEFALKLTVQKPGKQYTDAVFATNHTKAACGFTAQAQRGERTLGNAVFLAASGVGGGGQLEVLDVKGISHGLVYPSADPEAAASRNLYDPFIAFVVPE